MATNVMLRDLDLPVPVARGGRRLEIIADGLPIIRRRPARCGRHIGFPVALRWLSAARCCSHRRSCSGTGSAAEGSAPTLS